MKKNLSGAKAKINSRSFARQINQGEKKKEDKNGSESFEEGDESVIQQSGIPPKGVIEIRGEVSPQGNEN